MPSISVVVFVAVVVMPTIDHTIWFSGYCYLVAVLKFPFSERIHFDFLSYAVLQMILGINFNRHVTIKCIQISENWMRVYFVFKGPVEYV